MRLGYRRPLCVFCWLFVLGCAVCLHITSLWAALCLCGAGLLLGLPALFLARRRGVDHWRRALAYYLAFLSVALVFSGVRMGVRNDIDAHRTQVYADSEQIMQGTVLRCEYQTAFASGYTVSLDALGEDRVRGRAYLECDFVASLQPGDRITATVWVSDLRDAAGLEHHLFDGCRLLLQIEAEREIHALDPVRMAQQPLLALRFAAQRLQQRLSAMLLGGMDRDPGALCAALLLGDRSAVDGEISLQFRRSGVSHLLALSGMHLGIIAAVLGVLLRRMRFPRVVRSALVCVGVVVYLLLTGCAVSTTRASVMLLLLYAAGGVGRRADGLTSLSLFFAACVAWEPYMLTDVSLWLTSLAAAVPVAIVPALQGQRKEGTRRVGVAVGKSLAVSVLCTLMLLLPMWLSFGEVSWLSPLTTLLFSVPLTALLFLGVLWLLLLPFSGMAVAQFWCGYLMGGMEWLADLLLEATSYLSALPHTVLSLRYGVLDVIMPLLALCLLICLLGKLKRRYMSALLAASLLLGGVAVVWEHASVADEVQGQYVAVGKSEVLWLADGDDNVLIDLTDGSYGCYSKLLDQGLGTSHTEIDALLLTHYHGKHTYLLERLCEDVKVRCLYLPQTMSLCDEEKALGDEGVARKLLAMAQERDIEVVFYEVGKACPLAGDLTLAGLQYAMLERSEQPIVTLAVRRKDGQTVSLIGSAFSEHPLTDAFARDCIRASEAVILAAHGPLGREVYTLEHWNDELQTLIAHRDGAMAYMEADQETLFAMSTAECVSVSGDQRGTCVSFVLPGKQEKVLSEK